MKISFSLFRARTRSCAAALLRAAALPRTWWGDLPALFGQGENLPARDAAPARERRRGAKEDGSDTHGRDALREVAVEACAAMLAALAVLFFSFSAHGTVYIPPEDTPPAVAETPAAVSAAVLPIPFPTETGTETLREEDRAPLPADGRTAPAPEGMFAPTDTTFGTAVASPYAILCDLSAGTVLCERAADERIHPASLTKLMTLIVVCEQLPDLGGSFRVTREIVSAVSAGGGSNVGLAAGEIVTLEDLVYAMMLPSACDAAACLACAVAGSEENFAVLMNRKAEQMGLRNTHFVNASGMSAAGQYSSVRDMAHVLSYVLADEFMSSVVCTEYYTMHETAYHAARRIHSTMFRLCETYTGARSMKGATLLGGKTGTGANQWRCLASAALGDDGRYYLLVTCGATSARQLIDDTYFIYSNYLP